MRGNGDVLRAEKATPELLQSDHPSREETRFFFFLLRSFKSVAFLMAILVPVRAVVNRGGGAEGLEAENFQVRLMSAFMERGGWGGGRKPAEEFKRIVCKLS